MNDIAIVGAGVAGTAAAEYLLDKGYRPQLIDKASHPGGRCATRRTATDRSAEWFDYGAQYITAREPAFRARVDAELAAGRLLRWQPATGVAERVAGAWLLSPSPDRRERLIGPCGLNRWIRDRLADTGLSVITGRRLSGLVLDGGRWRLDCDDGSRETADAILLTLPAPQTATVLGERAASVAPLAHAERALSACHSLVVRAPALDSAQAIFFKSGALSWAADNSHKAGRRAGRHLWTLHADPAFSDARVETPAAALADELIAEFAAATGQRAADMDLIHAHRWRYARPGPGAPAPETGCWVDAATRIAIAGDWLAGGRVEGAWLSGHAAAKRLIAAIEAER